MLLIGNVACPDNFLLETNKSGTVQPKVFSKCSLPPETNYRQLSPLENRNLGVKSSFMEFKTKS